MSEYTKHFNLKYNLNKTNVKIGELRNVDLRIVKNRLSNKRNLSLLESEQLNAINYIIKARSVHNCKTLVKNFNSDPIIIANKAKKRIIAENTADLIFTWLKKVTTLNHG